jgi:hypothetical protein
MKKAKLIDFIIHFMEEVSARAQLFCAHHLLLAIADQLGNQRDEAGRERAWPCRRQHLPQAVHLSARSAGLSVLFAAVRPAPNNSFLTRGLLNWLRGWCYEECGVQYCR